MTQSCKFFKHARHRAKLVAISGHRKVAQSKSKTITVFLTHTSTFSESFALFANTSPVHTLTNLNLFFDEIFFKGISAYKFILVVVKNLMVIRLLDGRKNLRQIHRDCIDDSFLSTVSKNRFSIKVNFTHTSSIGATNIYLKDTSYHTLDSAHHGVIREVIRPGLKHILDTVSSYVKLCFNTFDTFFEKLGSEMSTCIAEHST